MRWIVLIGLLGWLPYSLVAQESISQRADSLRQVVETSRSDTARATALGKLAEILYSRGDSLAEAERLAYQGLALAQRIGYARAELVNRFALVELYLRQERFGLVREQLQAIVSQPRLLQSARDSSNYYSLLGTVHFYQGQVDSAASSFKQSVALLLVQGDSSKALHSLANLATIYKSQGKLTQSARINQWIVRLAENLRDSARLGQALTNLGDVQQLNGDYRSALKNLRRAEAVLEACACSPNTLGMTRYSQGITLENLKRYSEAASVLETNIETGLQTGNYTLATASAARLAVIYMNAKDIGAAQNALVIARRYVPRVSNLQVRAITFSADASLQLELGNFALSRNLARQGLALVASGGMPDLERSLLSKLFLADSALGDFRSAFLNYRRYVRLNDSIQSRTQARELGRLEAQAVAQRQMARQQAERAAERLQSRWMLGSAAGGLVVLAALALVLFRSRRRTQQANAALQALNAAIGRQRDEIETQHRQIEDSIRYASRIQQAILPSNEQLAAALPPHFIHYRPRDIVSGDFYWMTTAEDRVFLAAVDCTGHGVPGAFMSVVGHNILNQVVSDLGISRPEAILKAVDRRIGQLLHQHFGNPLAEASLDGMDLALVVLHPPSPDGHRVVEYAGAGRPLWVWDGQHLAEYRSGRYPCGGGQQPDKSYPSHRLTLSPGSRLYLGSDGITDQFGGEAGRKLGSRRLLDWLKHSAHLNIAEQGQALAHFLEAWQGERRQLDDLLLIGLELGSARSS